MRDGNMNKTTANARAQILAVWADARSVVHVAMGWLAHAAPRRGRLLQPTSRLQSPRRLYSRVGSCCVALHAACLRMRAVGCLPAYGQACSCRLQSPGCVGSLRCSSMHAAGCLSTWASNLPIAKPGLMGCVGRCAAPPCTRQAACPRGQATCRL